jgi:hypothetical protein
MFENPFTSEANKDELDDCLIDKGMSSFSIDNLCIKAPTKCGSTSMREFMKTRHPKTDVPWDSAETRILIIRDPWSRYYSGLREMFKWPENMEGDQSRESWNNCWNDHINEIYDDLWDSKLDFRYILMPRLPEYIGDIHMNRSDEHQAVYPWLLKEQMDHNPWVKLHIQRDFDWLKREQIHFQKIIEERQEVKTSWWREFFQISA